MSRQFIVDNLGYRLGIYHPQTEIQIGDGNPYADVLVVQPMSKMPERDAVTGALKKFGMLNSAYRATTKIVDFGQPERIEYPDLIGQNMRGEKPMTQDEANRYYLKELIHIIKPLIVVACGDEVVSHLKGTKVRSSSRCSGKKFRVKDMPEYVFYATVNPMDYGFARAPQHLKDQGREEWAELERIFTVLREKREKARWE